MYTKHYFYSVPAEINKYSKNNAKSNLHLSECDKKNINSKENHLIFDR